MFRQKVSYHKVVARKRGYARFLQKAPRIVGMFFVAINAWWEHWVEFILLSLVWTLSTVTVVLSPPITFGVFYALTDPNELDNRFALMLQGARRYAATAYLNALVSLLAWALGLFNISFYTQMENLFMQVMASFAVALLLLWAGMQCHLVPVILQQDKPHLWKAYRFALALTLAKPIPLLVMLLMVFLLGLVSIVFPPLLFLGTPALLMIYLHYVAADRMLELKLIKPEDSQYLFDPHQMEKDLMAVYDEAQREEKPRKGGRSAR